MRAFLHLTLCFFTKLFAEFFLVTVATSLIIAVITALACSLEVDSIVELSAAALFVQAVMLQLAVGYRVSRDEIDGRSLEFLTPLPLSRCTVFCAKFLAALAVSFIAQLFLLWVAVILTSVFESDPITFFDYASKPPIPYMVAWLLCIAYGLALCSLLGAFPKLMPLSVSLLIFTLMTLAATVNATFLWFIPSVGLDVEMNPWVQFHVVIGVVGLCLFLLSLLIFCARKAIPGPPRKVVYWRRAKRVAGVVLLVLVALGVLAIVYHSEEKFDEHITSEGGDQRARLRVANFTLNHARNLHKSIERYSKLLPDMDQRLRQLMGPDVPAIPIEIIFTDGLPVHAAGIAHNGTIRISEDVLNEQDEFGRVVSHELAHVYIDHLTHRIAGKRLEGDGQVLHEGGAEWLSRQLYDPPDRRQWEFALKLALHWSSFNLVEFADASSFRTTWGAEAVYVLGPLFVDTLLNLSPQEPRFKTLCETYERAYRENPKSSYLWPRVFALLDISRPALSEYFQTRLEDWSQEDPRLPSFLDEFDEIEYRYDGTVLEFRSGMNLPDDATADIKVRSTIEPSFGLSRSGRFEAGSCRIPLDALPPIARSARVVVKLKRGLTVRSNWYDLLPGNLPFWIPLDDYVSDW